MKWIPYFMLALAAVALLTAEASAGRPTFSKQVYNGYRKNVLWPFPDICPDRAYTRAPFDVMVQNGWRRQNLLGPHHFDVKSGELTTAGELKVHWVMTQAPPQYRQIFIERSLDPTVTEQRIAAARTYAEKVAINGEIPAISDTHLIAEGRPAAMVDFINVSFRENMPQPALPAKSLGTSGN